MHEKQKLLSMIRKYDFVLYELQLYLDTHPPLSRGSANVEKLSGNAAESGNGICPAVRSAAAFADQR